MKEILKELIRHPTSFAICVAIGALTAAGAYELANNIADRKALSKAISKGEELHIRRNTLFGERTINYK